MRILCVLWHSEYVLRLYESALRCLAADGHTLFLGFTNTAPEELRRDAGEFLDALVAEFPKVSFGALPGRTDGAPSFVDQLRCAQTCLAYQHPRFTQAPLLQARAAEELKPRLRRLMQSRVVRTAPVRSVVKLLLRAAEWIVPSDPHIDAAIRAHKPDLVFITPLVHAPARQIDYLKSARRLGLPTVVGVASWDNLTSKGLIPMQPDAVLVWNELQRREAVEIHGLDGRRVVVTGAQAYDHWFEQRPSSSRAEFCARLGLDPDWPIILYLCSSRFLQDDERVFIRKWLEQVRCCRHAAVRNAGVIIRPYPTDRGKVREGVDPAAFGNVAIWPEQGQHPLLPQAKTTYFDSLVHSAAVVAANTSGLIEAGIVGRRCFSMLMPEFAQKQGGMPHFRYLLDSGFLKTATNFDDHLQQLHHEFQGAGDDRETMRAFLASFIRPHGLERPAAPLVAAALENLVHLPRQNKTSRRGMIHRQIGPRR